LKNIFQTGLKFVAPKQHFLEIGKVVEMDKSKMKEVELWRYYRCKQLIITECFILPNGYGISDS
jgi:hypothetical protein